MKKNNIRLIGLVIMAGCFLVGIAVFSFSSSQIGPAGKKLNFKVMTVAELRQLKLNVPAIRVLKPGQLPQDFAQPKTMMSKTNPYIEGKGVVLTAKNLVDSKSASSIIIKLVRWDSDQAKSVNSEDPGILHEMVGLTGYRQICGAAFHNLPPGLHTYLLTLGHEIRAINLEINVGDQKFQADKLTDNPTSKEVRVLFSYDMTGQNYLTVFVYVLDASLNPYSVFHHLQLAQLD